MKLRLAGLLFLPLLPPAVVLAFTAFYGSVPLFWIAGSLLLSLMTGGWLLRSLYRSVDSESELLETTALHLERGTSLPGTGGLTPELAQEPLRRLVLAVRSTVDQLRSLSEQRNELEAVLRSMDEAVVIIGAREEVRLLNRAARALFLLAPDEDYTDHNLLELCRDARLAEFLTDEMRGSDSMKSIEVTLYNPAPRYLRVTAAPIGSPSSRMRALVFYDLTRIKASEMVRTDFISNLTHELRTPLTALRGYAETLAHGVDDEQTARRFLSIIETQANRLTRLIDDMLILSNLERGLAPLHLEPLSPAIVIRESVELMRDLAEKKGVSLGIDASPELPLLNCDRDRVQQVLVNLLDNAIKYTPPGGSIIASARTVTSDGAGDGIELAVKDTGEGIPAGHIPRLTERFYRVDQARSREMGGTGLGLSIVKHIVQLHNGRLRIDSQIREGTTVTVWLPAAEPLL